MSDLHARVLRLVGFFLLTLLAIFLIHTVQVSAAPSLQEGDDPIPTDLPLEALITPTPMATPVPREEPSLGLQSFSLEETSTDFVIDDTAEEAFHPDIAFNPETGVFLTAWQTRVEAEPTDVYLRYLSSTGQPLTLPIKILDQIEGTVELKLEYGGGSFLLVWREGANEESARLYSQALNGSVDPSPKMGAARLLYDPIGRQFDVGYRTGSDSASSNFVVVFLNADHPVLPFYSRGEILGRAVDHDGSLIGEPVKIIGASASPGGFEVLRSPYVRTDLSIANNPIRDEFFLTYGVYDCSSLGCVDREEIWGYLISGETLRTTSILRFVVNNVPGIQWSQRAVFHPDLEQYVVVWSDNRNNEFDFDLAYRRHTQYGGYLSNDVFLIDDAGSQTEPELDWLPGENPLPDYALVYQNHPVPGGEFAHGASLNSKFELMDDPFLLSDSTNSEQFRPAVTTRDGLAPAWLTVWEHARPLQDQDLHAKLVEEVAPGIAALSPTDWTMVMSIRPTFTWEDSLGANEYRLTVFALDEQGNPEEQLFEVNLEPSSTMSPENEDLHSWKSDRDFSSGISLASGGYGWQVLGLDAFGNVLVQSALEKLQIPPLGLNPGNSNWNRWDDLIYYWSEQRDLPPTLVKALIVKEHSLHLNDLPFQDARFDYLYEPRADHDNCVKGGIGNACNQASISAYRQPGNPPREGEYPRLLRKVNDRQLGGFPAPTIADFGADPINGGIQVSNHGGLANLTSCTAPDPDLTSQSQLNSFFDCVDDWFDARFSDPPPAQFRIMASYGLGQATYWSFYHLDEFQSSNGISRPERLYDTDFALQISTKAIGINRCYFYRDTTLGDLSPPFDRTPLNPYLGADSISVIPNISIDDDERREFRKIYARYNGAYPELRAQFHEWWRVLGKYNGYYRNEGGVEAYAKKIRYHFLDVQPVNLAEEFPVPSVQFEEAPHQLYRADIEYMNEAGKTQDAYEDSEPLPCPLLESELSGIPLDLPNYAPISFTPSQSAEEIGDEIGWLSFDLDHNGVNELLVLRWLGRKGKDLEAGGVLRVYRDGDLKDLMYENFTGVPVQRSGSIQIREIPILEARFLQVNWMTGAHGTRSAFFSLEQDVPALIPFEMGSSSLAGSIVGDKGGGFLADDGSVIVLDRGLLSGKETDVSIYGNEGDRFQLVRQYTIYTTVIDDAPPGSSISIRSPEPTNDWHRLVATVIITSEDDYAVRHIDYVIANNSYSEVLQTLLEEVEFEIGEGRWVIQYRGVDIYGNHEEWQEAAINVDATPPDAELELVGEHGNSPWFISDVEVTLSATDPSLDDGSMGSGVSAVQYSLDQGAEWQIFEAPFIIDSEGKTLVLYRAIDGAGNVSDVYEETIFIDKTGPNVSLLANPSFLWPPNGKLADVEFEGFASDNLSGLSYLSFEVVDEYDEWEPFIDDIEPDKQEDYTVQFSIGLISARKGSDQDGRQYAIHFQAVDVAGNITEYEVQVVVNHDQR